MAGNYYFRTEEAIMIQDILPHHFFNSFEHRGPAAGDIIFSYDGADVLLKPDHTFFRFEEVPHDRSYQYLFRIDETSFFAGDLKDRQVLRMSFRFCRTYEPRELGFACITGWQLQNWMNDSRFCGRCGTPMAPDGRERAMTCPNCGNVVYPRLNPAVIVAIINDQGQLLVTKYAKGPYQKYALVAGYAEIGETIEGTVLREVKEETGLDVTDLRYYKSQPWGFSSTLLLGFSCHVHGEARITLQREELRLAEWKSREDEIDSMDNASLTTEMIQMFRKGVLQ